MLLFHITIYLHYTYLPLFFHFLLLSFLVFFTGMHASDRYFNISSLARYQILFLHKHQKLISKEHLVNALLPSFLRFRLSVSVFNFPKKHIFRKPQDFIFIDKLKTRENISFLNKFWWKIYSTKKRSFDVVTLGGILEKRDISIWDGSWWNLKVSLSISHSFSFHFVG